MKTINLFLLFAFLTCNIFAQRVTVDEKSYQYNDENHNSLVTKVYYNDEKTVKKELENFFKNNKGKVSEKKGVYTVTNLTIPSLSTSMINAKATISYSNNDKKECEVAFAFDLGTGYISQSTFPVQFESAKTMVLQWSTSLSDKAFNEFISNETKILEKNKSKLESFNKSKAGLEKSNADLNKKITEYNDKITELNTKISESKNKVSTNNSELSKIESQIKEQQNLVNQNQSTISKIKDEYGK